MSKEEVAKRVEQSLDLFEQGQLIDMVAFGEDVRSLITQAAANKAAEEGVLPAIKTWRERAYEEIGEHWLGYKHDSFMKAEIEELRERVKNLSDRASRQVANKAEVDLSSLKRYYRSDTSMEHTRKSGGWVKFKDVRDLLATPPATTGASTARDGNPIYQVNAAGASGSWRNVDKAQYDLAADTCRRIVTEQVSASTVLTDERFEAMHNLILDVLTNHRMVRMFEVEEDGLGNSYPLIDRLCPDDEIDLESGKVEADAIAWAIADKLSETDIFAREVAAQAGQVAEKDRLLKALERAAIAESALRRLADEVENDSVPGWEDRLMACIAEANSILNGSGAGQVAVPDDWQEKLYAAMDAAFELRESGPRGAYGHRQGIVIDDTQVGVEFAMKWIEESGLLPAAPSPAKESK